MRVNLVSYIIPVVEISPPAKETVFVPLSLVNMQEDSRAAQSPSPHHYRHNWNYTESS